MLFCVHFYLNLELWTWESNWNPIEKPTWWPYQGWEFLLFYWIYTVTTCRQEKKNKLNKNIMQLIRNLLSIYFSCWAAINVSHFKSIKTEVLFACVFAGVHIKALAGLQLQVAEVCLGSEGAGGVAWWRPQRFGSKRERGGGAETAPQGNTHTHTGTHSNTQTDEVLHANKQKVKPSPTKRQIAAQRLPVWSESQQSSLQHAVVVASSKAGLFFAAFFLFLSCTAHTHKTPAWKCRLLKYPKSSKASDMLFYHFIARVWVLSIIEVQF